MFPVTIFSLYYKNIDRRGLRPLMLYIPGGLMMCNYVVWEAIAQHVPAQSELFQSKRGKDFTFDLQVVGIIITVVANLWNASVDTTVIHWIKKKGWLERSNQEWWKVLTCQDGAQPVTRETRGSWEADEAKPTIGVGSESAEVVSMKSRFGKGGDD